ncbi:hypothetical protein HY612_04600 [Candidatus Roizmanbacteria bacterium]|nr:hypothetical protein [Candidatus Roizmanbacteria bacterium]
MIERLNRHPTELLVDYTATRAFFINYLRAGGPKFHTRREYWKLQKPLLYSRKYYSREEDISVNGRPAHLTVFTDPRSRNFGIRAGDLDDALIWIQLEYQENPDDPFIYPIVPRSFIEELSVTKSPGKEANRGAAVVLNTGEFESVYRKHLEPLMDEIRTKNTVRIASRW